MQCVLLLVCFALLCFRTHISVNGASVSFLVARNERNVAEILQNPTGRVNYTLEKLGNKKQLCNEKQHHGRQNAGKDFDHQIRRSTVLASRIAALRGHIHKSLRYEQIKVNWNKFKIATPPIIKEALADKVPTVTISDSPKLTVNDVFFHLEYFSLLYEGNYDAIVFNIPIDGKTIKLELQNSIGNHKFTAHMLYEEPNGVKKKTDLFSKLIPLAEIEKPNPIAHEVLKNTIINAIPTLFDATLYSKGEFEKQLKKNVYDKNKKEKEEKPDAAEFSIPDNMKDTAFREAIEFASMSILSKPKYDVKDAIWVKELDSELARKNMKIEERVKKDFKEGAKTQLKYEMTANMLQTSEAMKTRWEKLKDTGVIVETLEKDKSGQDVVGNIEFKESGIITLHESFKLLQYFLHIYPKNERKGAVNIEMPIGKMSVKFQLRQGWGANQILVTTRKKDYGNIGGKPGAPYDTFIDKILKSFPKQGDLAAAILDSIHSHLNAQPDLKSLLEVKDGDDMIDLVKTNTFKRAVVEFMTITMIAEAAQPSDTLKTVYLRQVTKFIDENKRFPPKEEMPAYDNLQDAADKSLKEGRSPAMDQIAVKLLEDVKTDAPIDTVFTKEAYPARTKKGGTQLGKRQMHYQGDDVIPSHVALQEADAEHDQELVAKKARYDCGKVSQLTTRRNKRAICDLEQLDEEILVDESSIRIKKKDVFVDIVDRRDATKRRRLSIPLSTDELAIRKRIKENLSQSKRVGTSEKYAKMKKGLAIHGMIFSALGAVDYFSHGDNVRGGIEVSQSLYSLGGVTGMNKLAKELTKKMLHKGALMFAKSFKMEKGLDEFSRNVEKYMKKGVGKLMGDIPGVGLVFDIYFIEQDIDALSKLDFNNPADLKMLPLRIIDLVLDVDTTILNLIGTFCPGAEVITEPLELVLSVIRMGIDDFYIDIMGEMSKIDWRSPWAPLKSIAAFVVGFFKGIGDFITGGLFREMKTYQAMVDTDAKVIQESRNPANYFKIDGKKKNGEIINLNKGSLSSFAGFISFRLFDNGYATLEIGDVRGSHKNIKKTFKVDKELDSIVLGIGESGDFKYQTKTAKLLFIFPTQSYKVICGAKLRGVSLHGTYYGNSRANKFVAVQNQKTTAKPHNSGDSECNYGKMDLKFVLGNYHYNLYGGGGNDTFYLGPQMSKVTGGEGSDVFIIQSDGGRTVIDNFARDNMHDMVAINVIFSDIRCIKSDTNLDVIYTSSHHIRITNWFSAQNPNYYRHMSFRSVDGVIFVPKAITPPIPLNDAVDVHCNPVAIDKSSEKAGQSIALTSLQFANVKQVIGSESSDVIIGNDVSNILEGGKGADHLTGGRSEDTYIIRANEGCDTINNDAHDFAKSTDVVVLEVSYKSINARAQNNDLFVYQLNNEDSSCFTIENWFLGKRYQHMTFVSSDHVLFHVQTMDVNSAPRKIPVMLDYSKNNNKLNIDLSDKTNLEFEKVATVLDSPYDDKIVGNRQSNFLSCTGGSDFLRGNEGSDNYVVKQRCTKARINNFDRKKSVDLLLIEEDFKNLKLQKRRYDLAINRLNRKAFVVIKYWFRSPKFQHIWIRTRDGVTAKLDRQTGKIQLIPVEVSKDPIECTQCTGNSCKKVIKYDLDKIPWKNVTRFQLGSSECSYHISGNSLNNYIDPGPSNGYNSQYLKGKNGADTYILKHGYGEFNKINNFAKDEKNDILKLGLELKDIKFFFHKRYNVILASLSKPKSLRVEIVDFFKGSKHQHLRILTSDNILFEITRQYPFMKVLSVDLSSSDSAQAILAEQDSLLASTQAIQGSRNYPNKLSGTDNTYELTGGSQRDIIIGGNNENIIHGWGHNDELYGNDGVDIIFGGDGDDRISGGKGHDYIYGGNGQDIIDGGTGSDTMVFKGDGYEKTGVYLDLAFGFGKKSDAEGDTYESIENIFGSIHNDTLIGSDSDNNLYGLDGNDIIIVNGGGNDKLFGGSGKDRYIVENAYGKKMIDNYADDLQEDTLSLPSIMESQVCPFLIGDNLHLQITKLTVSSVLYQKGRNLTIIVANWGNGNKYRHLKVVFKDTIWTSYALVKIKHQLPQIGDVVTNVVENSNLVIKEFKGTSVKLSWNPILTHIPAELNTQLFIMKTDLRNPSDMATVQLDNEKSEIVLGSLDPTKYYIFALFLKTCSSNIATSTTITTFGQERACLAVTQENNIITYDPQGSLSHGTKIRVKCNAGYILDNKQSKYKGICIDSKWLPNLPQCKAITKCPSLPPPQNGRVTFIGNKRPDSVARYICKKGYELNGAPERVCLADATWENEQPTCVPLACAALPVIQHGKLEPCVYKGNFSKIHGTLKDPREGFCANLTCNSRYVESYRLNKSPGYEKIPNGAQVCKDGEWVGQTSATCEPRERLTSIEKYWLYEKGVLLTWSAGKWHYESSNDDEAFQLACSHVQTNYGKASILEIISREGKTQTKIQCPKIRFVNGPTEYEGHLEVFVQNKWQPMCYSRNVTSRSENECKKLCSTIDPKMVVRKPHLVPMDMGNTKYRLNCPPKTENMKVLNYSSNIVIKSF